MVKTFEEEHEGILEEKSFKILFTILCRYIQDTYKQYKWTSEIRANINRGLIRTLINDDKGREYSLEINLRIKPKILSCNISAGMNGFDQNFPITNGMTPNKLGKLAQNIFKWIKEQMKKIPN